LVTEPPLSPATPAPGRSIRLSLLAAAPAVLVLLLHARSYLPFISDDAFISLRYARRLLDGHGLTWTDGPRVEGYTNLLWVLACAALGRLGMDLIDAARVLGLAATASAIVAIAFAPSPARRRDAIAALAGAMAMALAAPVAVWAVGGLEQPLVAAFLAAALVAVLPLVEPGPVRWSRALLPGLWLGLLCLTRADGPVLCLAFALGILLARGPRPATLGLIAALAAAPLVLTGGQILFRLLYYGDWLPNPAYVKVAFTSRRFAGGLAYLAGALPWLAGLLVPAVLSIVVGLAVPSLRRRTALFAAVLLGWLGYVALIGGDIFPAHRHWVPAIVVLALLFAQLVHWLVQRGRPLLAGVGAAVLLASLPLLEGRDPAVRLAVEERWEWDGQQVGDLLARAFGAQRPLLACDPAGCLPYFSGLPSIDMLGLNDHHIARHRRPEFGSGPLAHDLGDGKYVLDRQPDLVIFRLPAGSFEPLFPSGRDMFADPRFRASYRFRVFETPGPNPVKSGVWVRARSEKIGIRATSGRIDIPGWFAASSYDTPAVLMADGTLATRCPDRPPATFSGLNLPPGRYHVRAEVDGPCEVRVLEAGGFRRLADGPGEASFVLPGPRQAMVDIQVVSRSSQRPIHLRRIAVDRPGR
jgi:hypothetical protein